MLLVLPLCGSWSMAASASRPPLCVVAASVQIMVHGLPFGYDTDMVKDMMKPCGGILNAHVFKDNLGRNKGYGLVCFDRYALVSNYRRTALVIG